MKAADVRLMSADQASEELERLKKEFDLVIDLSTGNTVVWSETSTFLARKRSPRGGEGARTSARRAADDTPAAVQTTSWHADADIGRRYAMVSGDFNFIHLSDVTAKLQSGVLGVVKNCTGSWCHISGDRFDGWIPQERLWGVYPNEKVD